VKRWGRRRWLQGGLAAVLIAGGVWATLRVVAVPPQQPAAEAPANQKTASSVAGPATGTAMSVAPSRNRMAEADSPYLRMHADNPVDWYPWGDAAFARARAERKPIFLSVGYSTCYWCHVMERRVFMDPQIAAYMNRHFVNIKVDREERPDVDALYMTAVHLLRGRGGWPMSVFLTPELKPFFGATYIPPERFRDLMHRIEQAWQQQRPQIVRQAAQIEARIRREHAGGNAPAPELPGLTLLERGVRRLSSAFDPRHGGFGQAPKFPQPARLEAFLSAHAAGVGGNAIAMVAQTLDEMARGGMYDQVGRGFHRYSTDERWLVPHFEKMLYDNAQLLHTYARAYRHLPEAQYARIADEIVAYVDRVMTGDPGWFYSAMDSETDHEEGKYYVWTKQELRATLTDAEFALVQHVYGVDGAPNFEHGRYILYWPQTVADTAQALELIPEALYARLASIRDKLLAVRTQREKPLIDDKVITSWNGLMIEALAYAGRVLDRPGYVARARRAARAVLDGLRDDRGRLLHVARGDQAKLGAYLDDYGAMILALAELDRADGDPRWRLAAQNLADAMIDRLWDPVQGGFYYNSADVDDLLVRSKSARDGAQPSGNSLAVRALAQLAARTGSTTYAYYAAETLKYFAAQMQRQPDSLTYMLWGLWEYHNLDLPSAPPAPAIDPRAQSSAAHVTLTVRADGEARWIAQLEVADGWHLNANPASHDFLVPTQAHLMDARGVSVPTRVVYPQGSAWTLPLGEGQARVQAYTGMVSLPLRPATDTATPHLARVRVQACHDRGRCLAPASVTAMLAP